MSFALHLYRGFAIARLPDGSFVARDRKDEIARAATERDLESLVDQYVDDNGQFGVGA